MWGLQRPEEEELGDEGCWGWEWVSKGWGLAPTRVINAQVVFAEQARAPSPS